MKHENNSEDDFSDEFDDEMISNLKKPNKF